jgi:hypothetical protein
MDQLPAPPWRMRKWMRRMWQHHDVRKHRSVRRWMYAHQGTHTALIMFSGYGIAMALLH